MTPTSSRRRGKRAGFGRFETLEPEHALAAIVAVLIGVTALWYGGSPPEITAAISVLTWWGVALGIGLGLIPVSRLARDSYLPIALLAALTVLTGLSFFWTNNEGLAFDKTVQMICILGLFVLVILCAVPGSARGWLMGMAGGLAFIVVLAVLSRYFPGLGDDPELRQSLHTSAGRLSWPLGYWNAIGTAAAMATILFSWFAATVESHRWRLSCVALLPTFFLALYLSSSRGGLAAFLLGAVLLLVTDRRRKMVLVVLGLGVLGAVVPVLVAAQMHDLVRAETSSTARVEGIALLAIVLTSSAIAVLLMKKFGERLRDRPLPRPNRIGWVVIAILGIIAVVAINPVKQVDSFIATPEIERESNPGETRNQTTIHLLSAGSNGRWQFWSVAGQAFKDEPVAGIGAGGFPNFYTSHRDTLILGRDPHSLPIRIAAELGIVGLLIAGGFLLSVLWIGWQRWTRGRELGEGSAPVTGRGANPYLSGMIPPFAAVVLVGMVSMSLDWTSEFPVLAAPVLISMAALVGPATRKSAVLAGAAASRRTSHGLRGPRELPAVLAIIVSGAAILLSAYGFGISHTTEQSRDALEDGDPQEAVAKAEDAVAIAPWSEPALLQLAYSQEASGNNIGALNALDRAIHQAPLDSAPWIAKLRVEGNVEN
ncbi:MAG: O-antigen ligase family protein, partial [Solirubrobacterales bacterium]